MENSLKIRTSKNKREFVLPKIPDTCPKRFPIKISRFQNCAETNQWLDWLSIRSGVSSEKFLIAKVRSLYLFLYYGLCDEKYRFEIIFKAFLIGSVWDDLSESDFTNLEFDEKRALKMLKQLSQMLLKLENNKFLLMIEWEPCVLTLYSCIETIYNSFNEIQKKRLIDIWRQHIFAMIEEYKLVRQMNKFSSSEEMIKIRRDSCGLKPFIQLIEYTDNIFVPEHEWKDLSFQKMIDMSTQHFTAINDIVSFEREFVREKNRKLDGMNNAVAFYVLMDSLSIDSAMKKLIEDKKQLEDQISGLEDEIIDGVNCSDATKKFIKSLNHLIGANAKVHQKFTETTEY